MPYFKLIIAGVVGLFLIILTSCSFERVSPGNVGVRVNNFGSQSGVDPAPKSVGWYFTPPGSTIYEYPVSTQIYVWKGDEEHFKFQDKNGMPLSADVAMAYLVDPSKAPTLFQKYRMGLDQVIQGPVNRALRNAVITEANKLSVEQIYGDQKALVIERARSNANRYLSQFGMYVESLTWDSNINLPEAVQQQIAARVKNEQEAIAVQAGVQIAQANANKRRTIAQGIADAELIKAKATAEATRLQGEALKANPESLEAQKIAKWKGGVPQIVSGTSQIPIMGPLLGK
jgi:regulator of protease activity HflC (stomatin/prohibitin superfamily)